MRKLVVTCLLLAGCFTRGFAQKLEPSNILLFNLNKSTGQNWQLSAPRFLTAFNPGGYNNQPQFFGPHELYLTVQFPADSTQTEIFALDLLLHTTARVTATTTPEYSPTPQPNGRRFSVVRVEADGAQRLWSLPRDRSDAGYPLFPDLTNVGYHCWLNDTLAALFLVGDEKEPHALGIVSNNRPRPLRVAFNVGRCLQKMPDGRLAYVHKATADTWLLKIYDPRKGGSDLVARTLPGSEDFAVLSDGSFLAGKGAKLYHLQPGSLNDWKEIADLSRYGVRQLTRLAVGADGALVVVVQ